jgi:ankyrin repeat protein
VSNFVRRKLGIESKFRSTKLLTVPNFPILCFLCCLFAAAPALAQARKEPLANLIESGNRKAALEQIRAGADVNEAQPDGTRPIHWAVYRVDYELLGALIAKKANLNVRNEFGSTPVAQAAELADTRMIKILLDAGAELEGANPDGQTALMLAIKTGEPAVVDMLIKAGANVNTIEKFHNQTPLMWAVTAPKNAGEMVKLLLAKGADVKPRALYTDWPSQITSEPRAQYRPVGGLTALLYAARDGCYDCVVALLGAGADVNMPTPDGVTPLMLALDNDHNEVAKLLLDRGANPQLWDWWGRTPLYIVIDRKETIAGASGGRGGAAAAGGGRAAGASAARRGSGSGVSSMDIINALLAAGVDLNPQLNMHRPSRGGNSGRFIDPLLNTGCTPLLRATMGGDSEVVRTLLAKGANPNINDMGLTPFLVAAGVGPGNRGGTGLAAQTSAGGPVNMELMELLLQHGADINAQVSGTFTYAMRVARAPSANEGKTALHVAAEAGKMDLVRYLLEKGANTQMVDADGHKAIDLVGKGTPPAGAPAAAANPATEAEIRSVLSKAAAR